ncbi:MAG: hypothetical protein ACT4OX_16765 [Actinomycetota bacterium]
MARGRWAEVAPGVFRAAPGGPISWTQRLIALTLSVDGVAYGASACALYGLLDPPETPEVLVVRGDRNRLRPGLHSTRTLPNSDIAIVRGIRATMPARSVIQAANRLPFASVCDVVDKAVLEHLVRPAALTRRAIELRNSKRPGCKKVLLALEAQHPSLDRARNEWEALVLRLAREYGLPDPLPNHPVVVGGEVRILDAAWPGPLVDLEFDGFRPHMVRRVFDDDRARQNDLVDAGWKVFRATSRLLEQHPERVFGPVARAVRGHDFARMRAIS